MIATAAEHTTRYSQRRLHETGMRRKDVAATRPSVAGSYMSSDEFWARAKTDFDKICTKYGIL